MIRHSKALALMLMAAHVALPTKAYAEDIDLFYGGNVTASNPSILFVLDNTSNWARQNQQWPGGLQQGQSEGRAIKTLLNDPEVKTMGVNMGLMTFVVNGTANNTGGVVRYPISPMNDTTRAEFGLLLDSTGVLPAVDSIYTNVNGVTQKRNSNTEYGNLLYDVYNYLTGSNTVDTLSPPSPYAHTGGYTTQWTQFKSPLTADNGCGRVFMVFIGNPNASGPADDTAANKAALSGLNCSTASIPLPAFTQTSIEQQTALDVPTAFASEAACISQAQTTYGTQYPSYSCKLVETITSSADLGTPATCYGSQAACEADAPLQYPASGYSNFTCSAGADCTTGATSFVSSCGAYVTQDACQTANPGATCGSAQACADTAAGDLDGGACYSDQTTCQNTVLAANSSKYSSVSCAVQDDVGCNAVVSWCAGKSAYNGAGCSAANLVKTSATDTTRPLPQGTYTSFTCTKPATDTDCNGNNTTTWTVTGVTGKKRYTATGYGSKWTVTQGTGQAGNKFLVKGNSFTKKYQMYGNYTVTTSVPTGAYNNTPNNWMADEWARCLHAKDLSPDGTPAAAEVFRADFSGSGAVTNGDTITFNGISTLLDGSETPTDIASKVSQKLYPDWYAFNGTDATVTFTRVGVGDQPDVSASDFVITQAGASGAAVTTQTVLQGVAATGGAVGRQNVTTYTIDVYNAQQNSDHTGLMMSMAQQGGGRYFAAKTEAEIVAALKKIVSDIMSVNTAFAAASIPLSTTNRSLNLDEVYIGVFRAQQEPRWFGNLRKFRIKATNGMVDLVDQFGLTAVNPLTGFIDDCAASYWTTDSGDWWGSDTNATSFVKLGAASALDNTALYPVPRTTCISSITGSTSKWSDLPDGQAVEKGSTAEVVRRGNNPPATDGAGATWTVNRKLLTVQGSSLVDLTQTHVGSATLYDYVRGLDIDVSGSHMAEKQAGVVRPSVHGDVVHSRPVSVNYGLDASTGKPKTVVFYGSNDGYLRAVAGQTGKELWAFIPPEFLNTIKQTRLMQNKPNIAFGETPAAGTERKNYMFDGSLGVLQNKDNTKVWIFATQRRGGRMVYALDVKTPESPELLWYQGCPNLTDDTGCTTGFSDIGQTWSIPVIARVKGYKDASTNEYKPIVAFGGGYDDCEDVRPTDNPPTWPCTNKKGQVIYLVDAETGALLTPTPLKVAGMRGVTGGISFVDVNNDGLQDYGYATDLGGGVYRISFMNKNTGEVYAPDAWTIHKVAYASGGRKFMFSPSVTLGSGGAIYVTMGSGDRERPLAEDYPYEMEIKNYIYGYRDDVTQTSPTACHMDGDPTAVGACNLDYGTSPATCDSPGISPTEATPKRSWRANLVNRGEQTVTQSMVDGGLVTLNTTRPIVTNSCSTVLGQGCGYWLNLRNSSGAVGVPGTCGGAKHACYVGVGMPPDPVIITLESGDTVCLSCADKNPPGGPPSDDPCTGDDCGGGPGSPPFKPQKLPDPNPGKKSKRYNYIRID